MAESEADIPYLQQDRKSLFLQKETLIIVGGIVGLLLFSIAGFNLLYVHFKTGFIWLISFIIVFFLRKSNAWKFGIECVYFTTFILTYAYGYFFAFSVVYGAMILIPKFRPDELNGVITHMVVMLGVAYTANYASGIYGPGIAVQTLWMWGLGAFIAFDMVRNMIARKIAPVSIVQLVISTSTGAIINSVYYNTIGISLLAFLYSIV